MSNRQITNKYNIVTDEVEEKLVNRISDEEHSEIQVPIDEDELEFIYEDDKEEVYCNTLDLNNLNICFKKHTEYNEDYYNSVIIKSKQEDIKDYNKTYECGICLENMKFVNYKAKSVFNKIARQRKSNILNPLIQKTKSKYSKTLTQFKCNINDGFTTQCGHRFHKKCLIKSLMITSSDCPMCRYDIVYKK